MKSKYWIMLLAVIVVLCLVPVLMSQSSSPATQAQIRADDYVGTVDLWNPQELVFTAEDGGYNTVTVQNGKIAVTEADCPDQHCVQRGFCNSGTPIVCLPHKLVITFMGSQEIDGEIG